MGAWANKVKTIMIFVLLILLLVAYFHPETSHELAGKVTAALGMG